MIRFAQEICLRRTKGHEPNTKLWCIWTSGTCPRSTTLKRVVLGLLVLGPAVKSKQWPKRRVVLSPAENRWFWRKLVKILIVHSTHQKQKVLLLRPRKSTKMAGVTQAKWQFSKSIALTQSRKCAINNFWTKNPRGLLGWGSRGSRQIICVRIFPNIWSVFGTANRPNINNFRDRQPA